jgi:hypothetical protein
VQEHGLLGNRVSDIGAAGMPLGAVVGLIGVRSTCVRKSQPPTAGAGARRATLRHANGTPKEGQNKSRRSMLTERPTREEIEQRKTMFSTPSE